MARRAIRTDAAPAPVAGAPYSQAIAGITRFVILHMVDVAIRQPGAFSFASDLS